MLILIFTYLSIGFIGLYLGAKLIIISLENIATRLGLSHLLIGLTILAIGTSLPEIAISVMGGLDKITGIDPNIDGIIIGNKVGSFFTQITLILGLLGLTQSIFISKWRLHREGLMLLLSIIIFLFCAIDGVINRIDALIMILSYFAYLVFIIWNEKKIERVQREIIEILREREGIHRDAKEMQEKLNKLPPIKKSLLFFGIGLVILLISAEFTIISAHLLSIEFNIPENMVGILLVGLGTSLPELFADLTAIKRKSEGIAIGDILGSNICDLLLATGSGAIIAEFNVPRVILYFDIPMLFIALILTYLFLNSNNTLTIKESIFLLSYYSFYVILKISFFQI
ncbi:MAG: calcium/sodium antiporter [Promethearchaeota archaeon]